MLIALGKHDYVQTLIVIIIINLLLRFLADGDSKNLKFHLYLNNITYVTVSLLNVYVVN